MYILFWIVWLFYRTMVFLMYFYWLCFQMFMSLYLGTYSSIIIVQTETAWPLVLLQYNWVINSWRYSNNILMSLTNRGMVILNGQQWCAVEILTFLCFILVYDLPFFFTLCLVVIPFGNCLISFSVFDLSDYSSNFFFLFFGIN